MAEITVSKRNEKGEETWRYSGRLVEQKDSRIVIEAFFDRPDTPFHGTILGYGDRFVEYYYTDRWYNVYEIHAREDDHIRCWYCNIACPAKMEGDVLSYVDLALDLIVFPDGRQLVLDEDEFDLLVVDSETRARARQALSELQNAFKHRTISAVL